MTAHDAYVLAVCKTLNQTRDTTHGGACQKASLPACRKRPFAIHRGVRARPGGTVSGVAVVAPGASQPGRAQKKGRLSQPPRAVIRIKWPRPGPGEAVYETGFRRLR